MKLAQNGRNLVETTYSIVQGRGLPIALQPRWSGSDPVDPTGASPIRTHSRPLPSM